MTTVGSREQPGWNIFPPLVWIVLAGSLLTRTAFFMVWPFLAVILEREFQLSPSQIGSVLGAAFIATAVFGFYSGNLSDRFGRRPIMIAGCVSGVAAYVVLATAGSVAAYAVGALLAGLSRAVIESPGKALIVDYIDDLKRRDLAFHARYFLINVGGAVGPLLGLVFGLAARQPSFWITAGANALFGLVILLAFRWTPERDHASNHDGVSLQAAIRTLRSDRQFLLLLLAMFLSMFAYAQQESTLIQYVSVEGGTMAITLVGALMITNGVTIVVFQFPMLKLMGRYGLYTRVYTGVVLFTAAFIGYALLPVAGLVPWIATTWLLSVGEAILFPTLQIQVDRMAPVGLKGSYFGAAGLSALGFGIGPFVGGFTLEHLGGPATFWLTALSTVLCGVCYWLASRHAPAVA